MGVSGEGLEYPESYGASGSSRRVLRRISASYWRCCCFSRLGLSEMEFLRRRRGPGPEKCPASGDSGADVPYKCGILRGGVPGISARGVVVCDGRRRGGDVSRTDDVSLEWPNLSGRLVSSFSFGIRKRSRFSKFSFRSRSSMCFRSRSAASSCSLACSARAALLFISALAFITSGSCSRLLSFSRLLSLRDGDGLTFGRGDSGANPICARIRALACANFSSSSALASL